MNPMPFKEIIQLNLYLEKSKYHLFRFKDQVIFEEREILKSDNKPYTIFTPYKNRWLQKLTDEFSVMKAFDSMNKAELP